MPIYKTCVVCSRLYVPCRGDHARCPEHRAQAERTKNQQRAANKARRARAGYDDPEVREAMAVAVAHARRCNRCGALAGTPGLKLHAHWPKSRYGPTHQPYPALYEIVCDVCHGQMTAAGE